MTKQIIRTRFRPRTVASCSWCRNEIPEGSVYCEYDTLWYCSWFCAEKARDQMAKLAKEEA
jgi:ribosomal protein L24E